MKVEYKQASAMDLKYINTGIKIQMAPDMLEEIMYIAKKVNTEVSGMGDIEWTEEGFRVTKLRFFPQECTGSETEIKPESLEKLSADAIASGEDLTSMRFWWHSHANMSTFWSKQDDDCVESLLSAFQDYVVSVVVNHKRELVARVDFLNPFRMTLNHVPLIVESSMAQEKQEALDKMIQENVKTKTYGGSGYGSSADKKKSEKNDYQDWDRREPFASSDYSNELRAYVRRTDKAIWDWDEGAFLPRLAWEEKKKKRYLPSS